jgi:glycosyltransferase involved in cell wall biosynthesis
MAACATTARKAVGRFFLSQDVRVILAEFGDAGAAICSVADEFHIPLVVHFHGHDAHRTSLLTASLIRKYAFMFTYAAAILVVSRYMWNTLAEMGCPTHKLIYNPYGPRQKFFSVQPDYSPTVLSVGRFTDIKANYLVLMAFSHALIQIPHAKLVMAGSGELLETCRTLAEVWGVERSVEFTGPVEHGRVHELFANACCFAQHSVIPSYGDAEGTPNTILEASAAALPVIATRHAGIPDVVVDGKTGFLVAERDVAGMADAMVRALQSPELCRQLGQAARDRIRTHFSVERHVGVLNDAIRYARNRDHRSIRTLAEASLAER